MHGRTLARSVAVAWTLTAATLTASTRCQRADPARASAALPASASAEPAARTSAVRSEDCEELERMVCREIGPDSGVCRLLDAELAALTPERCRDMFGQRERTLHDLRQMEDSRLPLDRERWQLLTAPNAPSLGPAAAKVTVVVFVDFVCPRCLESSAYVPTLPASFADDVRVVVRQLPAMDDELSRLAAEASLAADAQGKFWEYYARLTNNQHDMSRATLDRCAREVRLDFSEFDRALRTRRFRAAVERDRALADRVLAGPAPYFFVNRKRVAGKAGPQALQRAIEESRGTK